MGFLLQLEDTNDYLSIHNGGSDNSEMVAKLTGQMNDTTISISGNQMFVVFKTNHEIVSKGFHALIMESKFFQENKLSEIIYFLSQYIHFYFIDDHCQYWLNKEAGAITSSNYDHNLNCTWILKADQGYYITLEIEHFKVNKIQLTFILTTFLIKFIILAWFG